MDRRLGVSEDAMLITQGCLAITYGELGHHEKALEMERDVYSGRLKLNGEEHKETLIASFNCASSLMTLKRFKEAKLLLRKTIPVARRVLGESHLLTLKMRCTYSNALFRPGGATLDDLHEAVTTLEDTLRIARRVLGGAHPSTKGIAHDLRIARAVLCARETPSPPESA